MTRKIGMILLGTWLVLKGLMPLIHLSFRGSSNLLALIALAAGILILIDR